MIRIPASDFREEARGLADNQQINVNHTFCFAGVDTKGRLYIRKKADCILAYCHNCGGYGFVSLGNKIKRLEELVQDNAALVENGTPEIAMPDDSISAKDWLTWDPKARMWLERYYVTQSNATYYGIRYSPSYNRVVLPVFDDDGKLIFWQGRAIAPGQSPKYISVKAVPKPLFVADPPSEVTHHTIFIVEDMLSAIRIAEFAPAIALLGTSATASDLMNAVGKYRNVIVYLDNDEAGRKKAVELEEQLRLVHPGMVFRAAESMQAKEINPTNLKRLVDCWT